MTKLRSDIFWQGHLSVDSSEAERIVRESRMCNDMLKTRSHDSALEACADQRLCTSNAAVINYQSKRVELNFSLRRLTNTQIARIGSAQLPGGAQSFNRPFPETAAESERHNNSHSFRRQGSLSTQATPQVLFRLRNEHRQDASIPHCSIESSVAAACSKNREGG